MIGKFIVPSHQSLFERSLAADANLDANIFAELCAEDAVFQIAALPEARGREVIRQFLAGFFAQKLFTKLEHRLLEVYDSPEVLLYRAEAIYSLADGSTVVSPYVNRVLYRGELFGDYRVHIDPSPLFERAKG
ncbi:MAG: nuclear transport factor 2 family protein [Myxococcales bacterium]|nr:nuclear transport factor 2 family protein [Myxococcales bacterium]